VAMRIGIILAGGESRRFGSPKAFATFKDKPLYDYVVEALRPFVDHLVIVSHPNLVDRFSQDTRLQVVVDDERYIGRGPLAGLYTVMSRYEAETYYVLPCDTPLVSQALIKWLDLMGESHPYVNGVVPIVENRLQPLFGLYRKGCLPYLEELLASNSLKVKALIDQAHILCASVDSMLPDTLFFNVNTRDELSEVDKA
jgi:molybdopterin-guanine dinucleotide biosynthesis protein A